MFGKKSQLVWLIIALAGLVFYSAPSGVKAWTPKDVFFKVADINPGGFSTPYALTQLGGKIYFGADGGPTIGTEFWVYDPGQPVSAGTNPKLIADIEPGSGPSIPNFYTAYQGKLYFQATTIAKSTELYVYDPNLAPSATNPLLVDILIGSGGSYPAYFAGLGPDVYFQAGDGFDIELWKYPVSGVSPIKIDYPNNGPGNSFPQDLTELNGKLYFSAFHSATGREIWVFDPGQVPSFSNPSLVWDIAPSTADSNPQGLVVFDGRLFFSAEVSSGDQELWEYNPGLPPSSSNPHRVADIWPGSSGSYPFNITPVMDTLYFSAATSANGTELWSYMPNELISADNPHMVADINPGVGISFIKSLENVEGVVYFHASDDGIDHELWRYDPERQVSSTNPMQVADINPGSGDSSPNHLTFHMGLLYFGAEDGVDRELFAFHPTKIFADGFESGNTKAWSKMVGRKEVFEDEGKCKLCVVTKGALFEKYSLKVKAVNKKPHYVQDDSPDKTNRYRARFYVKLKGLKMGNKNNFKILLGKQGKKTVFFLQVRRKGKRFQIRGALRTNGGKMRKTKWAKLPKKSTPVEFDWSAKEAVVPGSGYFRLSINDKQVAAMEKVSNDKVQLNSVRLGITGKIKPPFNIAGSFLLDAFDSDGLFRIGP